MPRLFLKARVRVTGQEKNAAGETYSVPSRCDFQMKWLELGFLISFPRSSLA